VKITSSPADRPKGRSGNGAERAPRSPAAARRSWASALIRSSSRFEASVSITKRSRSDSPPCRRSIPMAAYAVASQAGRCRLNFLQHC
jgi:hypothetical protein